MVKVLESGCFSSTVPLGLIVHAELFQKRKKIFIDARGIIAVIRYLRIEHSETDIRRYGEDS